jgi:hypothetical protein
MGVNGTWFVIEPAGCKLGTNPATAAASQAPASSGGTGSSSNDSGGYSY